VRGPSVTISTCDRSLLALLSSGFSICRRALKVTCVGSQSIPSRAASCHLRLMERGAEENRYDQKGGKEKKRNIQKAQNRPPAPRGESAQSRRRPSPLQSTSMSQRERRQALAARQAQRLAEENEGPAAEGPDAIDQTAEDYVTDDLGNAVKIRMDQDGPDARRPISVPTLLTRAAEAAPEALAMVAADGVECWTYSRLLSDGQRAARAMVRLGLRDGGRVAIIGFNSPEWFLSELGVILAGGVAAGVYPTNATDACKAIVNDCSADIVLAEDASQVRKFLSIKADTPSVKALVQYSGRPQDDGVLSWSEFMAKGDEE